MFYYVSLRSKLRVVIFVAISAYKRYLVDLYLQFAEGCMSYLRYLCLFAHSGVQMHIMLCFDCLFGIL
jgi:hypothetical protein